MPHPRHQSRSSPDPVKRASTAGGILFALGVLLALGGCFGGSPSPTASRVPHKVPPAVTFKPIDGGVRYFERLNPRSAWMDHHILLGAWLEQPLNDVEVGYAAALGENIYWNLAGRVGHPSNNRADYDVIRAHGMHVSAPDRTAKSGSETVMYDGSDESDMNFGPGSNGWRPGAVSNRTACVPTGSACGYTVDSFYYSGSPKPVTGPTTTPYPIDGLPIHQGSGKGVLFWDADAQASKFLTFSDVASADSYWLTDPDLRLPSQGGCALLPDSQTACAAGNGSGLTAAQAELPANYAYNVTRLERLNSIAGRSKPIVVAVETGCPFTRGSSGHDKCPTPAQFTAAAWHVLIAGARGIVWFQHGFSGPCPDLRTFIDGSNPSSQMYHCQQTPGVTLHDVVLAVSAFNHKVAGLTQVLLSPTVAGYVSTRGEVSTMAKVYGGSCYVFTGAGRPATPPPANHSVTFTLADRYTGAVHVYGENRTLRASQGTFTDTFAGANAIHIYQIVGGSFCEGP